MEPFHPEASGSTTRNRSSSENGMQARGRAAKAQPAAPPARNILATRRNEYPRVIAQGTPPPKKKVSAQTKTTQIKSIFSSKQRSNTSLTLTKKAISKPLTPTPDDTDSTGVTPLLFPQNSPQEQSFVGPNLFSRSTKTPRTPSPAPRQQRTQQLHSETDDIENTNTDQEENRLMGFQAIDDAPPTRFTTHTLTETPTLDTGGYATPDMVSTPYIREAPDTKGGVINNFPEIQNIHSSLTEFVSQLHIMEMRLQKQEEVQEKQGVELMALTSNQQTIYTQIKSLSDNQDKLAESQTIGFNKLVTMISSLQDTLVNTKKEPISTNIPKVFAGSQTELRIEELKEEPDIAKETSKHSSSTTSPSLSQESKLTASPPMLVPPFQSSFKANKPEKFNGKVANNALEKWIQANEIYAAATNITPEQAFYFALSNLKEQASDWWLATSINLKEQGKEMKTFEELKTAMRHHFTDHTTKSQAVSNLRVLQEKKTVNGYTAEFLRLRLLCPELPEKLAKDYFIEGLQADIRPHVALRAPQTVDQAVEAAVMAAAAVRRVPTNTNRNSDGRKPFNNAQPYKQKPNNNNPNAKRNNWQQKQMNKIFCNFCRKPGHLEANCRRKQATKERKDLKNTEEDKKKKIIRKNNINQESEDSNDSEDLYDCDVIKVNCCSYCTTKLTNLASTAEKSKQSKGNELITVLAHINGRKARILIDSGAGGNFISEEFAKVFRIRKSKMEKPVTIQYADKRQVRCLHEVKKAHLTMGQYNKVIPLIVAPLAYDAILGKPWLTMENPDIDWQTNKVWVIKEDTRIALPRNNAVAANSLTYPISFLQMQREAKQEGTRLFVISIQDKEEPKVDPTTTSMDPERTKKLMLDFPNVFTEEHPGGLPEQTQVTHKIELIDNEKPPCKQLHLMSQSELVELRQQLDVYLEKGWIRPSDSPFGAPVLFALKKDGSKRLCIDYRALNKITKKSKYPLPRFEELQAMIGRANWFSKIDLANGYHQVPVHEDDCYKTAFRTRFGQFEWTVMPFGLTNAPATFQRLINNVLRPLQNKSAAGILDDILIFTEGNKEKHDTDIREVVQLLADNKLYAKPKKCFFFQQQVEYWGHVISKDGWTTEKHKIEAIRNWPSPLPNVHAVRSFIGMCAYYRRYVKDFAQIALPLHELIRKDGEFLWNAKCDAAMKTLKEKLCTAPVLRVADCTKPFVVTTDASKFAVGAVLQQYDEQGELRPVAFESRKLKVNRSSQKQDMGEVRYPTHEKEMLAIIHAAKVWRHLLLGNKVTFLTDHMPLKHLQQQSQLSDRQLRWMEVLQQYDFEIKYKPGVENTVADALSRRCDLQALTGVEAKDPFLDNLTTDYEADKVTAEMMKLCRTNQQVYKQGHRVFIKDNLLCVNKNGQILVWIPSTATSRLVQIIHDEHGHPGKKKLAELVHRSYWWPRMTTDINTYVKKCEKCQMMKSPNSKPQGLLQPLPVAKGPWQRIAMDLITDLPLTNRGNDAILTVTDTFTKYMHIQPTKKTATANTLADLLFDTVLRLHGIPLVIISDRDPRFLSDVWKNIWSKLGTRLAMSTAFHPQTDGQSERTNRSVITSLRLKVNDNQDDWDIALPLIELNLNNTVNETTGFSPFFANFNYNPRLPPFPLLSDQHDSLGSFLNKRVNPARTIRENITKAQQRQKEEADKRRQPCEIKKGDYVLLSTKHLRFRGPSKKLAPKYIGPFEVLKVINRVTCELKLPKVMKIFNKFHVSLLKRYQGSLKQDIYIHPGFMSNTPIEEFEVESILQDRTDQVDGSDVKFYLVKWKNADYTHATWEPEAHLANARKILRQYAKRQARKRQEGAQTKRR